MVYTNIIDTPVEKILQNLKDIVSRHNKSNLKKYDFYQNLDILNIWHERIFKAYTNLVAGYNRDIFNNISAIIKLIEAFIYNYVDNFMKDIHTLNEKIESENVLKICNDTIFFLSNLLAFEISYEFIKKEFISNKKEFSAELIIDNLIRKMESKAQLLDKKYPPLKFIFLINNIYFIQSKILLKPFSNFISKNYAESLSVQTKNYVDGYLNASWGKVNEITFNEKENLSSMFFEQDGKTMKSSARELIKKKFAIFNEAMKINLKFQQNIQIIDSSLEKMLINANIEYIAGRYQEFVEKFGQFTPKCVLFSTSNDVVQDLKLYFMPNSNKKK
jgi:hypothetical protein